jgi:hypothetical protein
MVMMMVMMMMMMMMVLVVVIISYAIGGNIDIQLLQGCNSLLQHDTKQMQIANSTLLLTCCIVSP